MVLDPSWLDIGARGLVVLFVLLVFTGQLVPGREMRQWRRAFFAQQRINAELASTGTATRDVLHAIHEAPDEETV